MRIERDDDRDPDELRPEHLFLKAEAGHEFSMLKIFNMENYRAS
jgi:hypothetical protein